MGKPSTDGKRRRVQSAPPPAPLTAPAAPITCQGWTPDNVRLLEEWKTYLCAFIKHDLVLTEVEAESILEEFRAGCQEAQDRLLAQQSAADAFLQQARTEAAASPDWFHTQQNKDKENQERKGPYSR